MYNLKRGEDTEQIGVIEWANWNLNRHPELTLLFHIPNGGKRNATEAARFKAMGVKAGVPDLFLPVPKGGFAGLWIEMKYGKNKTTDNQVRWLGMLQKMGYKTIVCYSGTEATQALEEYLTQTQTILCTAEDTKPEKRIAVYLSSEDKEAFLQTLQAAVTDGQCIFGSEFKGCMGGQITHCAKCVIDNVEIEEYD